MEDNSSVVEAQKPEKETQEIKDKGDPQTKCALEKASQDIDGLLSNLSTQNEIPDFVDKYLDLADDKISSHESILEDNGSFLKLVNQISELYRNLSDSGSNHGALINRIGKIQQRAMCYLEDEFMSLMEESRTKDSQASDQSGEDQSADHHSNGEQNYPGYSHQVLTTLNKIAKEMILGGYESECYEAYMITRRNIIEEALNKLGYEKISIDDAQKMQWEALEKEIPPWIKAFKQCINLYFSGERKLVETVFSDYLSLSSTLFSNLVSRVFIQLLNFAEAVATVKRSTEKLFKFLDIYETLRGNISAIDSMVAKECAEVLWNETNRTRCRIGETAICIFCDLENAIQSDTGKTPVPGGAVHPLTRYTMNYVKYACDEYKQTIEQVFKDHSKTERARSRPRNYLGDSEKDKEEDDQSPFVGQVLKILELLDSALEAKSKLYKDTALSCIFLMNNERYMLQKIKASAELHQAMRDTWCRKTSSELRNYHNTYKRETWMKLLSCLNVEGLNVNGKVVKPVLKERFKSFNAMFDEIHKTQSSWVVNDKQLQSELRVSISAIVIPAYRSFLARFSGTLDPGRQTEKYIKFQPDDIEACIEELFDGNSGLMARKKT
ncbi:hypothetical protein F3Y22_tig00111467pilonHSYRG00043 [Hibiscus syriacus]|uniref:Exocyst subunit Exo70 family protein n=1 Tax=Hibiscus syriacus TaxID=106335 RepID=A0A6A2XQR3_HIBSY|nr:exocyst complex component EXO70B1-like [Hibiscus syriacus]KAE8677938.1 hypothetical protein F3Y22_tig00111467pilonHSYRG00043 [Hibiscus syriacus]